MKIDVYSLLPDSVKDYIAEETTTLNEQVDVTGSMGMYLEALQRVSKK